MDKNNSNKEFAYRGVVFGGFVMLLVQFVILPGIYLIIEGLFSESAGLMAARAAVVVAILFLFAGYFVQQPNQARVMIFFGNYRGTFHKTASSGSIPLSAPGKSRCASATSTWLRSRSTTRWAIP